MKEPKYNELDPTNHIDRWLFELFHIYFPICFTSLQKKQTYKCFVYSVEPKNNDVKQFIEVVKYLRKNKCVTSEIQ